MCNTSFFLEEKKKHTKKDENCLANNIVLEKGEIVQQPAIYLDDKK